MGIRYEQLSAEGRGTLTAIRSQGSSVRAVARTLGRSASTISQELARNGWRRKGQVHGSATGAWLRRDDGRTACAPAVPQGAPGAQARSTKCAVGQGSEVSGMPTVPPTDRRHTGLRVARNHLHGDMRHAAGHPASQADGAAATGPRQALATQSRRPAAWADARSAEHPCATARRHDRLLPGHWEGDFLKGEANRGALGVLVARGTPFLMPVKMGGCSAAALDRFRQAFAPPPAELKADLA